MIDVAVANEQSELPLDEARLREAARAILEEHAVAEARISLAVVDDAAIARLHAEYLGDGDPTDVLSFVLEQAPGRLEGEVIVSAETARAMAPRFGWTPGDELLLYVVHGMLHLVGHRDATPRQRAAMRRRERAWLARFGVAARYKESATPAAARPRGNRAGGKKVS